MIAGSGLIILNWYQKCCVYDLTIKILIFKLMSDAKIQPAITGKKTAAFDFAHHGHASVMLYVQFLCSDWSKFDRWVHAENLCSILNLGYFDSSSWQSFESTGCTKWNSAAIRSLLLSMAGLFIGFLVEKYVTCQSRKSDSDGIVLIVHLSWCVRRLQSLKRYWPYLIALRTCISSG